MNARRVVALVVALFGLGAIIMNRRFGRASVVSSREIFGINMREGSLFHKFTVAYSRIIAIVVGSTMAVIGFLIFLGVL